jgi:hypothetical protein
LSKFKHLDQKIKIEKELEKGIQSMDYTLVEKKRISLDLMEHIERVFYGLRKLLS